MINKEVNAQNAYDFIINEIKEISERWAQFTVSIMGTEKMLANKKELTEQENKDYDFVSKKLLGKNEKQRSYVFQSLSDEQRTNYTTVQDRKNVERLLENNRKSIVELEEYLETANAFKKELELCLKK